MIVGTAQSPVRSTFMIVGTAPSHARAHLWLLELHTVMLEHIYDCWNCPQSPVRSTFMIVGTAHRMQSGQWLGRGGGHSPRSAHGDDMECEEKHHGKTETGLQALPPWRSASWNNCTGNDLCSEVDGVGFFFVFCCWFFFFLLWLSWWIITNLIVWCFAFNILFSVRGSLHWCMHTVS